MGRNCGAARFTVPANNSWEATMNMTYRASLIGGLVTLLAAAAVSAALAVEPAASKPLQVAQFTADGKMQKPADLTEWVFLGTSLGMGYNPGSFNAANPGQFQVAMMEPSAYRYFVENRKFAPGSMFVLSFYESDKQQRSINQNGFTQAELTNFEIHLIDTARGEKGHAFYMFGADATEGSPVPPQIGDKKKKRANATEWCAPK